MKTKNKEKLVFKKTVISHLDQSEMYGVKGGVSTVNCLSMQGGGNGTNTTKTNTTTI